MKTKMSRSKGKNMESVRVEPKCETKQTDNQRQQPASKFDEQEYKRWSENLQNRRQSKSK